MKKNTPYNPDEARKKRLAEHDAREKRLAKAYKDDPPQREVKAPVNVHDEFVSKLYPNG